MCFGISNVGFFDPVYANHVRTTLSHTLILLNDQAKRVLSVESAAIGALFVVPPLAYGVSGGLVGDAADKRGAIA